MDTRSQRLLLNAEPFGFGPAAAIAAFFPHLRPHFETIGYMGKRHTLDLQASLPYDAIHDVGAVPKQHRFDAYETVFADYDILFTAMDHKAATYAARAGLKVFYYDALAWYWPDIPQSVLNSDLYLAQDFFGVKERMQDVFRDHAHAHIVPPIVPNIRVAKPKGDHVLINLGGLQNPFWDIDGVVSYARTIIDCLKPALTGCGDVIIAASKAVSERIGDGAVKTYPRSEMMDILARSNLAFMTPGLGNIYDAATYNIRTVWLPPANDSQGQQLCMLECNNMADAVIHWSDLFQGPDIKYTAPQQDVLAAIVKAAAELTENVLTRTSLSTDAAKKRDHAMAQPQSKTTALIEHFGDNGDAIIARRVIERAKQLRPQELRRA